MTNETTRSIADVLHGTWLGHPLHPMLTDLAIGGWTFGLLFDYVALTTGSDDAQRTADQLTRAGTYMAVPTILAGLADYSGIQKPATATATLHAVMNDIGTVMYAVSLRDRKKQNYRRAIALSTTAFVLMGTSSWLGGHLVYAEQVGVDHSRARSGPEDWTDACASSELESREPKQVDVEGSPVLLYRTAEGIYAIGALCSHAGAPLKNGSFDDCMVQCPWHDSVFDVRSGKVKHGPATRPQPKYDARETNDRIEVRMAASRA